MNDALERAGTSPPASEGFCCHALEQRSPVTSGETFGGGGSDDSPDTTNGRFIDQPLETKSLIQDDQTNTCR